MILGSSLLLGIASPPDSLHGVRETKAHMSRKQHQTKTYFLVSRLANISPLIQLADVTDLPWIFPSWSEYRGVSYPIGTDSGALTIPNILSHYVNLTGGSVGKHVPMACLGSMCAIHPEGDGTNAAVSGSKSGDLMSQVRGGSD
jgi:hypothetical protein